jgi:heptosyltransferase-2
LIKVNPEIRGVELITTPAKILILKNRALGDSVLGLSSVAYLKSLFPETHITYGVPQWVLPLYQKVNTSADSYLGLEMKGLGHAGKLFNHLKRERFDLILELHQSGRMANFFSFYRFFSRTPYIFHNHNIGLEEALAGGGNGIFDQGVRKANIQRDLDAAWTAAGKLLGDKVGQTPTYLNYKPEMSCIVAIEKNLDQYVFGVVATRSDKMWPIKHFHKLAKILNDKKIIIPLSPSIEDKKLEQEFCQLGKLDNVEFLYQTLADLPNYLAKSSLYIGNDTGLKHICAALGVRTFTLFGPEEPLEWHPYNERQHPFFWIHGHDVRSQTKYLCALKQFDVSRTLDEIEPEDVMAYLEANHG